MDQLQQEIQELFSDLWQVPRFSGLRAGFRPHVDCFRTDDALTVLVELPGVDPDKVDLFVAEGTLYLAGNRARPSGAGQVYQQMEIDYGPFRRQVSLGADVDLARARATYAQGVLTIVLPVAQRPRRGRARRHRGDARVNDDVFEPVTEKPELPPILPVLPLKETVVFPESMTPLAIGQERSIRLIDDVVAGERLLALVAVKNDEPEAPGFDDLYDVGTAAIVHKLIRVPDGTLRILVQGVERIHLDRRVDDEPYLVGRVLAAARRARSSRARSRR